MPTVPPRPLQSDPERLGFIRFTPEPAALPAAGPPGETVEGALSSVRARDAQSNEAKQTVQRIVLVINAPVMGQIHDWSQWADDSPPLQRDKSSNEGTNGPQCSLDDKDNG